MIVFTSVFAEINTTPSTTSSAFNWQNSGPNGGDVTAMLVSPVNPSVIYAGGDDSNVYMSNNAGASWTDSGGSVDYVLAMDNQGDLFAVNSSSDNPIEELPAGSHNWIDVTLNGLLFCCPLFVLTLKRYRKLPWV